MFGMRGSESFFRHPCHHDLVKLLKNAELFSVSLFALDNSKVEYNIVSYSIEK